MKRVRICAAAMAAAIAGISAFPSQAGIGVMVIGGSSNTGSNNRCSTGNWGYGINYGSNCGSTGGSGSSIGSWSFGFIPGGSFANPSCPSGSWFGQDTPNTCFPEEIKPGSGITKPGGSLPGETFPDADDNLTQEGDEARTYILQVIALVNEERAKAGLAPVEESGKVAKAAAVRAQEITRSFSHTRPDGSSFSTALRQSGAAFNSSGENIAYGQPSPKAVMDTWMNSQTHRANILDRKFTDIGVGCYIDSRGVIYWTQLFTD